MTNYKTRAEKNATIYRRASIRDFVLRNLAVTWPQTPGELAAELFKAHGVQVHHLTVDAVLRKLWDEQQVSPASPTGPYWKLAGYPAQMPEETYVDPFA